MGSLIKKICGFLILLSSFPAYGSHIVGGEATYQYLGLKDSTNGLAYNHYVVSITIYEDCYTGQPNAILADNPAFFAAYDSSGFVLDIDTSVYYDSSILVPLTYDTSCIGLPPTVCLLKKTFTKTYYFPPSTKGYVIAYQRCCRNAAIVNVSDPGNTGATYYCRIPPSGVTDSNNSAIFKNYPPQLICVNYPIVYDNSATDADGDSLTYEFCPSITGADGANVKPIPSPPPYSTITYLPPFTYLYPLTSLPEISINPTTGLITGTPTVIGRYLVSVCCHEWRNGVIINTIIREFQFVVAPYAYNADTANGISPNVYSIDKISVYPNPSQDIFYISYQLSTTENVSINIFNSLGQKALMLANDELQAKGYYEYEFQSYATGIYTLKAIIGKNTYTQKIIKY